MKQLKWLCLGMVLCICLTACGKQPVSAETLLLELMAEYESLPDGVIYRSGAEEGEAGYPSPELMESLYGANAAEVLELVEDYAIYLSSFAMPIELAVFRCYSATDAHQVEAMCLNRREALRVALRGTELEELSDSLQVQCKGRLIVMRMEQ